MTIQENARPVGPPPHLLDRVLVPLDGSRRAEEILHHLIPLLQQRKGDVLLLTVLEGIAVAGNAFLGSCDEDLEADARRYLEEVSRNIARLGSRARVITCDGPAPRAILESACENRATLVALATHGHRGLSRLFFGSVAEEVLRTSPVPMLVSRSVPGSPRDGFDGTPRKILVTTDGSPASVTIVEPVLDLSRATGASVTVVHVAPSVQSVAGIRGALDTAGLIAGRLSVAGVAADTLLLKGDPASRITELVRDRGFDLVAMATHGRSGFSRMVLGSVTESVLRSSEVPLLVHRAPPGR